MEFCAVTIQCVIRTLTGKHWNQIGRRQYRLNRVRKPIIQSYGMNVLKQIAHIEKRARGAHNIQYNTIS